MLGSAILLNALLLTPLLAAADLRVDGAPTVTAGKKAGYKIKCGEELHFSLAGPSNIHIEVRGGKETKSAILRLVRDDRFASDTQVAMAKAKDGTKDLPLYSEINFAVPNGDQKYTVTCTEGGELAFFIDAPKKATKTHLATAEKEQAAPKPAASAGSESGSGYPFYLAPTHM